MAIRGHNTLDKITGRYFAAADMEAERGIVVVRADKTIGTGKPGDSDNTVKVPGGVSGEVAIGILFDDVIPWDRSQTHFPHDRYRNATTPCRPVNIVVRGEIRTDKVAGAATPQDGEDAYFTTGGLLTDSAGIGPIGKFRGVKDSDGFVVVHIDL